MQLTVNNATILSCKAVCQFWAILQKRYQKLPRLSAFLFCSQDPIRMGVMSYWRQYVTGAVCLCNLWRRLSKYQMYVEKLSKVNYFHMVLNLTSVKNAKEQDENEIQSGGNSCSCHKTQRWRCGRWLLRALIALLLFFVLPQIWNPLNDCDISNILWMVHRSV